MAKQSISEFEPQDQRVSWAARFGDSLLFVALLILPALAIAAVAVAAPIILAVSVIAGLAFKKVPAKSWRPAGA